jgi:hypothetical protein
MKHIEFTKLIEKYENTISASEELEISQHLLTCVECALVSKKLAGFFDYAQVCSLEEITQSVTANLLNIYQPQKKTSKKDGFVKRLFGELVFDDWQFALNERLAFSDTRQMLYKVSDFDIDLRLQFANGKCIVSGQIFPDLKEKVTVEIISETAQSKAELNETCEFSFQPVLEGTYDLQIHLKDTQIEISKIPLLH